MTESTATAMHGPGIVAESLHLYLQVGGRDTNWKWAWAFETSKPAASGISSSQTILPNPSQAVPLTGDRVFEYMNCKGHHLKVMLCNSKAILCDLK